MKALVLEEYNKFAVKDVPMPDIGPDDVLVRVKACGICGSDVHGMDGSSGRRIPPIIMGHEAAGVIDKVGANVTDWKVGEPVTFDSMVTQGSDYFIKSGHANLSDNRQVLGVSCEEFKREGAYAEYVAIPQSILYRMPEGLSFEHAAMCEPLSVAFHAVDLVPTIVGDTAVVVGSGMIGLLVIQTLRMRGCGTIIAVDLDQQKLDLACELGADYGLKSDTEDVVARVQELTEGRGADVCFEVVGISPTVELAIKSARKGGAICLVGNVTSEVTLPLQAVVTRQLTIYGSCASNGQYPACMDMLKRGAIKVDPFISAEITLDDAPAWFDRLYKAEPGLMKVIVKP